VSRQHTTPKTYSVRHLQVTKVAHGTTDGTGNVPGQRGESDRRAHAVVHGNGGARRGARDRARVRTHDRIAPRGVRVRRRHRAHRSRNDRHAAAACAKWHARGPRRPAGAAATTARSTAAGRPGSRPLHLPTKLFALSTYKRARATLKSAPIPTAERSVHRRVRQWARSAAAERGWRPRCRECSADRDGDRGLPKRRAWARARTSKESRAFDLPGSGISGTSRLALSVGTMDHGGRHCGALGAAVVWQGHPTCIRDLLAVCKQAQMLT
jgi:hypothetical protein